jgi:hypothetical protein
MNYHLDGSEIRAVHDGPRPGVSTAGNETGWREALAKLAALVEVARRTGGELSPDDLC